MEREDRTYPTVDGSELPMRVWRPDRPRATLVYLHGIHSHSGWYETSSRHLAEAGVAVYQIERRGSGPDRRHERGHVDRAETWLADVAAAAEVACRETAVPSVHLLGVSWGGKLALACAAHRPDLYRSLVMSAPGLCPRVDLVLSMKIRVAGSLLIGDPLKRFPIPLGDPYLFTENPDRVRYVAEDSLSLRDLTARFLFESRRLDHRARRAARTVRLPAFLALAECDRIIDNAATEALFGEPTAAPWRVVTYPAAHHTLEFEPDPAAYLRDLVAWIDAVESGRSGGPSA